MHSSDLETCRMNLVLLFLVPFRSEIFEAYIVLRWADSGPLGLLLSYMICHIELKFCIWLRFTVLQIMFECRQFASIFVGVMPFLERSWKYTVFPHFSPTCFDILKGLCFTALQIKFEYRQFASIFEGVMPLLQLRTLEIHSFSNFSPTCWYIELKFGIWLSFNELQIKWLSLNLGWSLKESCPFVCTVFYTFLLHALRLS